jgi:hypothetical protein
MNENSKTSAVRSASVLWKTVLRDLEQLRFQPQINSRQRKSQQK